MALASMASKYEPWLTGPRIVDAGIVYLHGLRRHDNAGRVVLNAERGGRNGKRGGRIVLDGLLGRLDRRRLGRRVDDVHFWIYFLLGRLNFLAVGVLACVRECRSIVGIVVQINDDLRTNMHRYHGKNADLQAIYIK